MFSAGGNDVEEPEKLMPPETGWLQERRRAPAQGRGGGALGQSVVHPSELLEER